MNQHFQHRVEFTKIMKIMSTLYFETPLTAKSTPNPIFFAIRCLYEYELFWPLAIRTIFWEKSPTHNNVAPKLNA